MFVVVASASNANLYNQETVIAIRPIITNFVHSEALEAIIPPQPFGRDPSKGRPN